jgi:hypothetical protein
MEQIERNPDLGRALHGETPTIAYRPDKRCGECGAHVDFLEGVVAHRETPEAEVARLYHAECWRKKLGYGNGRRYW